MRWREKANTEAARDRQRRGGSGPTDTQTDSNKDSPKSEASLCDLGADKLSSSKQNAAALLLLPLQQDCCSSSRSSWGGGGVWAGARPKRDSEAEGDCSRPRASSRRHRQDRKKHQRQTDRRNSGRETDIGVTGKPPSESAACVGVAALRLPCHNRLVSCLSVCRS